MSAPASSGAPEPLDEDPQEAGFVIPLARGRQCPQADAQHPGFYTDGNLALKSVSPAGPGDASAPEPPHGVGRHAVIVARAIVEVLSGWRPASQLSRFTSYPLQQDLEQRAPRRPTGSRQQLLRVRVSEPADGIAEVCALTHDLTRKRVRVMALRLERREGNWVVTRLQAG